MYRRHPLFFGDTDIPAGLSVEDRKELLEQENILAEERDAKARDFALEMERQRKAQESEMVSLAKKQEAARVSALEEQEKAAADYTEGEGEAAAADRERRITGMWGALATSQEQENTTEDIQPE